MSTAGRRLDALSGGLTARERAILALRAWCAGETPDERLTRSCPPEQQTEVERIRSAVEWANDHARATIIILLEWLAVTEAAVHAYRVWRLYRERVAALERVAKKPIAPLTPPWDMRRTVPLAWGGLALDADDEPAADWEEYGVKALEGIERSLSLRWRDFLGMEAVFTDIARNLGEPVIHRDFGHFLDAYRDHIRRLAAEVRVFDPGYELPESADGHDASLREVVDWDAIRSPDTRVRQTTEETDALEAWEREQAARLRRGS